MNAGPQISPSPLPGELLQYLSTYRVVICTSCQYAIQPKAIERHLQEIHGISASDRRPFMHHVADFDLADQELVIQYAPSEFPVPLLPVYSGLQCKYKDCGYLSATEKRMQHHWRSVHGKQTKTASCDWQMAPLQTFFRGSLLRYFTAVPAVEPAEKIPDQHVSQHKSEVGFNRHSDADSSNNPTTTTNSPMYINDTDTLIMHHFTTNTWLTLATEENTRQMWHVVVPQLAYQHAFLMHAVLACTALHMAYLNPDQRSELIINARTHQYHAMPLFRSAISTINSKTCDAVLLFTRLLAIYTFASEEQDDPSLTLAESEDRLPSWIFFLRSGCSMLCEVWDQLETGPVKYLATWGILLNRSAHLDQPLIDYFLSIPPSEDWPDSVRLPYNDSARGLARSFSCLSGALDENITALDVARLWPVQNSAEFVELLSNWHPAALILLAHYCIILNRLGTSWYLEGRASSILSMIVKRLERKWHRYIEWPLLEIGLLPSRYG